MTLSNSPECGCQASDTDALRNAQPDPKPDAPSILDLDLGGGVALRLARIPAGESFMGHFARATIRETFYMGVYPVTQMQYEAVTGKNPSGFKGADLPVERVSWDDAMEFCRIVSAKTGRTVRLPTDAEWEYACRAGTTTAFSFGKALDTNQANYNGRHSDDSRKGEYRGRTTPVGSFPPNTWGLYDMHGNVWEWCSRWNGDPSDGSATYSQESTRVLRGGSWNSDAHHCASSYHMNYVPGGRYNDFGFRVYTG